MLIRPHCVASRQLFHPPLYSQPQSLLKLDYKLTAGVLFLHLIMHVPNWQNRTSQESLIKTDELIKSHDLPTEVTTQTLQRCPALWGPYQRTVSGTTIRTTDIHSETLLVCQPFPPCNGEFFYLQQFHTAAAPKTRFMSILLVHMAASQSSKDLIMFSSQHHVLANRECVWQTHNHRKSLMSKERTVEYYCSYSDSVLLMTSLNGEVLIQNGISNMEKQRITTASSV